MAHILLRSLLCIIVLLLGSAAGHSIELEGEFETLVQEYKPGGEQLAAGGTPDIDDAQPLIFGFFIPQHERPSAPGFFILPSTSHCTTPWCMCCKKYTQLLI